MRFNGGVVTALEALQCGVPSLLVGSIFRCARVYVKYGDATTVIRGPDTEWLGIPMPARSSANRSKQTLRAISSCDSATACSVTFICVVLPPNGYSTAEVR